MSDRPAARVLAETRYLRLVERDGWSFVERPNATGVVTIVALTPERRLLFVEQLRKPVGRRVIEFPAGLVGDEDAGEPMAEAARRELQEETGWHADRIELVAACPTSPGMTAEIACFFKATELRRVSAGGGVAGEDIRVHEVPIDEASRWLRAQETAGLLVAAKAYAGLLFAYEAFGVLPAP